MCNFIELKNLNNTTCEAKMSYYREDNIRITWPNMSYYKKITIQHKMTLLGKKTTFLAKLIALCNSG